MHLFQFFLLLDYPIIFFQHNYKMRMLVKKSQEEVQDKLDELMEEKLQAMEEGAKKATATVKEKMKDGVEKVKTAVKEKNTKA